MAYCETHSEQSSETSGVTLHDIEQAIAALDADAWLGRRRRGVKKHAVAPPPAAGEVGEVYPAVQAPTAFSRPPSSSPPPVPADARKAAPEAAPVAQAVSMAPAMPVPQSCFPAPIRAGQFAQQRVGCPAPADAPPTDVSNSPESPEPANAEFSTPPAAGGERREDARSTSSRASSYTPMQSVEVPMAVRPQARTTLFGARSGFVPTSWSLGMRPTKQGLSTSSSASLKSETSGSWGSLFPYGRVSATSTATSHEATGSGGDAAHLAEERSCPECGGSTEEPLPPRAGAASSLLTPPAEATAGEACAARGPFQGSVPASQQAVLVPPVAGLLPQVVAAAAAEDVVKPWAPPLPAALFEDALAPPEPVPVAVHGGPAGEGAAVSAAPPVATAGATDYAELPEALSAMPPPGDCGAGTRPPTPTAAQGIATPPPPSPRHDAPVAAFGPVGEAGELAGKLASYAAHETQGAGATSLAEVVTARGEAEVAPPSIPTLPSLESPIRDAVPTDADAPAVASAELLTPPPDLALVWPPAAPIRSPPPPPCVLAPPPAPHPSAAPHVSPPPAPPLQETGPPPPTPPAGVFPVSAPQGPPLPAPTQPAVPPPVAAPSPALLSSFDLSNVDLLDMVVRGLGRPGPPPRAAPSGPSNTPTQTAPVRTTPKSLAARSPSENTFGRVAAQERFY